MAVVFYSLQVYEFLGLSLCERLMDEGVHVDVILAEPEDKTRQLYLEHLPPFRFFIRTQAKQPSEKRWLLYSIHYKSFS
jgi:hypothetical protein